MNRQHLTELRSRARAQLNAAGLPSALAALAPLVEAMAREIHASTATYLDRDHFDDEARKGSILKLWREARAEWLTAGRTGMSPGRLVLEQLVSEHLDNHEFDDRREILDTRVFQVKAHQLLQSTAKAVFGSTARSDVLADCLVERVQELRHEDWIAEFRRALSGTHAELVYVPNWDGESIDDMIYELGLRASRWNQSLYVDEIQPCEALAKFLSWLNIGTDDLLAAARDIRPNEADKLALNLANFKVERDAKHPSLVSPSQAIEMMENAVHNCVPMYHCEVDLGALMDCDPHLPMTMSTAKGTIHIGLHDVINGTGCLDTYTGTVTIPADHLGFGWVGRWDWGIDKVYGLVKSYFHVRPASSVQEPQEQAA